MDCSLPFNVCGEVGTFAKFRRFVKVPQGFFCQLLRVCIIRLGSGFL